MDFEKFRPLEPFSFARPVFAGGTRWAFRVGRGAEISGGRCSPVPFLRYMFDSLSVTSTPTNIFQDLFGPSLAKISLGRVELLLQFQ